MAKMTKDIVKEHERDLTKERDERCVPVAKQVLKMIANYEEGLAGNVKPELIMASYDKLAKDILQFYLDSNLLVSEVNFIDALIKQILGEVNGIVNTSVNQNLRKIQNSIFNGTDINEVTLQQLDAKLKESVK